MATYMYLGDKDRASNQPKMAAHGVVKLANNELLGLDFRFMLHVCHGEAGSVTEISETDVVLK